MKYIVMFVLMFISSLASAGQIQALFVQSNAGTENYLPTVYEPTLGMYIQSTSWDHSGSVFVNFSAPGKPKKCDGKSVYGTHKGKLVGTDSSYTYRFTGVPKAEQVGRLFLAGPMTITCTPASGKAEKVLFVK